MKFYDRTRELQRLDEIAATGTDAAHLVVITGRRRIGKTALIKHFGEGRAGLIYFFVGRKKPQILLDEFTSLLAERIPLLKSVKITSFEDFFAILFEQMAASPLFIVFDEFQNFLYVDPSVFSTLQHLWDNNQDRAKGAIICVGSIQTLMRNIFEGNKEPLFGRATAKIHLTPLAMEVIATILADHQCRPKDELLFFTTLFGGVPKYYFLLDRHRMFASRRAEIISGIFCEPDAILQNEGRELLIEEFGKNHQMYFSIMQVIAGGETQMARIADSAGLNTGTLPKYLDELISYYQVIERRVPVTASRSEQKNGRYHIADPLLRFWFRYIFRNQSLIELGETVRLTKKIMDDLPTLMGHSFENLTRDLLTACNDGSIIPFVFDKLGGYWNRTGSVEIDIVALDDTGENILFGECKLSGERFTIADARKLKAKAAQVVWNNTSRKEFFLFISHEPVSPARRQELKNEGIGVVELSQMLKPNGNSI
ncbi:MAG: ATPase [Deltaproteobacteria bacterium RIFOXYD12_FULL_50_9]|nr:MAG: ATPase [Deltaproteobacteria bacterium RIFOXYD12_FULL_50_9]